MVVGDKESMATKMQVNWWQFRLPWRCSSTGWGALPDGAHPGLHSKPLDAAIA